MADRAEHGGDRPGAGRKRGPADDAPAFATQGQRQRTLSAFSGFGSPAGSPPSQPQPSSTQSPDASGASESAAADGQPAAAAIEQPTRTAPQQPSSTQSPNASGASESAAADGQPATAAIEQPNEDSELPDDREKQQRHGDATAATWASCVTKRTRG